MFHVENPFGEKAVEEVWPNVPISVNCLFSFVFCTVQICNSIELFFKSCVSII